MEPGRQRQGSGVVFGFCLNSWVDSLSALPVGRVPKLQTRYSKAHSGNPPKPPNPKPSGLILTQTQEGSSRPGWGCALSLPVCARPAGAEETFPNIEVACEFPMSAR